MELETYAKLMNKTEGFPWTQFLSQDYSEKSEGKKKERVNRLAQALFYREFCGKYGGKEIVFENDSGKELSLKLDAPRDNANYTNYDLHFTEDKLTYDKLGLPSHIVQYNLFSSFWISGDGCISHGGEQKLKEALGEDWSLKEDSVKLIDEMLGYQEYYKGQFRERFLNERLEGAKYAGYNNEKYKEFINERNGWNKPEEKTPIKKDKSKFSKLIELITK